MRRLLSAAVLLLLGSAAVAIGVAVPVSYACPFGQVFEYDGCVPSPLLYSWTDSSPSAPTTPSTCVWEMPWGPMSLPCNIMNCQVIIYPTGFALQSQPVQCSPLTVSVQRVLAGGAPGPVAGDNVSVSAMLTCRGPGDTAGQVDINVSMTGQTDSSGTATFLVPTTLGSGRGGSHATCYSADSPQASDGFVVREADSGRVSAGLSWPDQQGVTLWLPNSGASAAVKGNHGWFDL